MPVFQIPAFGIGWIVAIVAVIGISLIVEVIRNRNSDIDDIEEAIEDRVALQVLLPYNNTTSYPQAEQFLSTIHGFLQDKRKAFGHISLEIVASSYGIQFFVITPPRFRKFIEGQIYAQYPYAQIKEVPDYLNGVSITDGIDRSLRITECELKKEFIFPIQTWKYIDGDSMNSITSAMQAMGESDMLAYQVVARPINNSWQKVGKSYVADIRKGLDPTKSNTFFKKLFKLILRIYDGIFSIKQLKIKAMIKIDPSMQDLIDQVDTKSNQSGYEAVIRILSVSKSKEVAEENLQNLIALLRQFSTLTLNSLDFSFPDKEALPEVLTKFKTRFLSSEINDIFSTEEIATLFHFPNESVMTPNIAWIRAKQSESPVDLPTESDLIIGETDYRGVTKKFGIKREDRRRHMYMIGKTGSGKTTLLKNMIMQDILHGEGVGIIDPHGDLIEDLLNSIPEERVDDVVLIDPSDAGYPVGINIFDYTDEHQRDYIANSILSVFKKHFDSWGPRLEYILHNVILTSLFVKDTNMLSIQRILTDPNYRRGILEEVTDPIILRFWNEEYAYMERNSRLIAETISPIQNKVGRFLASKSIRNIVGHNATINFEDILNQKKILLCNLSQGRIGEDSASLFGSLIVTQLQSAAMQRVRILESEREDYYLYVDEFQLFTTDTFAKILSEARKYKLNLILAHQYLQQIPENIKQAIIGNVGTMISFVIGSQDAKELEREFFSAFTAHDLISLENYAIYIKESIDGVITKPFSAKTLPFSFTETHNKEKIIASSREKYANTAEEVESAIREWSMKSFTVYKKYDRKESPLFPDDGTTQVTPDETLRFDSEK